jgi:hypothetical protein
MDKNPLEPCPRARTAKAETAARRGAHIAASATLALGAWLTGCAADPMTLQPTVYVDEAFSATEAAHVKAGLDNWETSVPQVSFTRRTMSHEALRQVSPDANAIYIVRNTHAKDSDCPGIENGHRGMDDDQCGVTVEEDQRTRGVICLNAVWLNDHQSSRGEQGIDGWKSTVVHEVGHAFHLSHDEAAPSVMMPVYWWQDDQVTCEDVKQLSLMWGIAMPKKCVKI